jgi:hypothetical protein
MGLLWLRIFHRGCAFCRPVSEGKAISHSLPSFTEGNTTAAITFNLGLSNKSLAALRSNANGGKF